MEPAAPADDHDRQLIQQKLCEIVSGGIIEPFPGFDVRSDLFDAGLDSLAIMQLLIRIDQEFGVRIPTHRLTRENFSTIEDLARLIEDGRSDPDPA
jgi:aryl carrier-like protein